MSHPPYSGAPGSPDADLSSRPGKRGRQRPQAFSRGRNERSQTPKEYGMSRIITKKRLLLGVVTSLMAVPWHWRTGPTTGSGTGRWRCQADDGTVSISGTSDNGIAPGGTTLTAEDTKGGNGATVRRSRRCRTHGTRTALRGSDPDFSDTAPAGRHERHRGPRTVIRRATSGRPSRSRSSTRSRSRTTSSTTRTPARTGRSRSTGRASRAAFGGAARPPLHLFPT